MRARFVAPREDRLDRLVADCTKLSRKKARALIPRGGVRVDGVPVDHPAHTVARGAVVEVRTVPRPEDEPEVVERYRDEWLLVADKPAGLPTQSSRQGGPNLFGLLQARHPYVGLHHRLDTPASGLVLFTLRREANKAVADGFASGAIKRHYQAVVVGDPGSDGVWNAPLDGEEALTGWTRVARGEGLSVIEATLVTGRYHQLRLHALQAGHPILGDRRHGGAAGRAWPRLALHAVCLELTHPSSEEHVVVDSPIPDDLAELFLKAGAS